MVDWLSPTQLARTGVKAVLSSIFGAYADKRELQAALHPWNGNLTPFDGDYSQETQDDFWFDYVADLGDGFDSTYAVAWLLARERLTLEGDPEPLPRGRFLVMGGDQVYPTASRKEYENRFRGPYEAALPSLAGGTAPDLYAIPGNHDWYDGLTSFTRLFCQTRHIGGWATRQVRSYFALRLPHNWWLWGVDIQLSADIDRPQLEFFGRIGDAMKLASPDAADPPRLILCTGQPSWTDCGAERPERRGLRDPEPARFENLAFFEDRLIRRKGIRLAATLSGDLHHYMRYTEEARFTWENAGRVAPDVQRAVQRITSGGGGAYLYPTHHMPNALELEEQTERVRYRREGMFPGEAESHAWARRIAWLPFRNWRFSLFLGALYLLFAWTLQSASKAHAIDCEATSRLSLMECLSPRGLAWHDLGTAALSFWEILRHSPSNVVFGLLVVFGLYQFRASEDETAGRAWGAVHGLAHVGLNFALIWAISVINLRLLQLGLDDLGQALLFLVIMVLGGGLLGGALFAFYLWASSKDHARHINEVFSSQRIADCKNFLRLRIARDGTLTIHPIGIPRVPKGHDWTVRDTPAPGEALIEPRDSHIPVIRIEDPISCR